MSRRAAAIFAALRLGLGWACLLTLADALAADEPAFHRAINLNGPALEIDGRRWDAGDAAGVACDDAAFENQAARLVPETDPGRARMIRSSRWSSRGKARVVVSDAPRGTCSVLLYVWEDNDPQVFDVRLNGLVVARGINSGRAGHWRRLGPWVVAETEGRLELVAEGGHANLSGLEIWRGKLEAAPAPRDAAASAGEQPADLASAHPASAHPASASSLAARAAVLLARNCLECHNASDRKGGLDLTRRERALAGGDGGVALVPGDAGRGALPRRVAEGEMPPDGRPRLADADLALLREWIAAGAKWAADPIDPFLYTSDRRAGYNWWSLQPPRAVAPPPADNDWPINPIDNFVLARLKRAGLAPAPPADRRTLARRVTFDLTGLPPTWEQVEAFVADPDPRAYERLVDRLLASPRYGERWARRWLDLARFAESQGFERNKFRPSAWKYRDFVVEAFNSDLPYDEFIRWQLAGDALRPDDPLAVIASGFLALGPYDLTAYNNGTPDMRAFAREEELEGLAATVGQTFLGLTVHCARCHDHKFDPITQREFYRFTAALGGVYQGGERESRTAAGRSAVDKRLAAARAEAAALAERERAADPADKTPLADQRRRLEALAQLLAGGPVHAPAPRQPPAWRVLARGDFRQPGEEVAAGGVAAVTGVSADWRLEFDAPESQRRAALAAWITDPDNPLTARVMVNRLWGWTFGQGLAAAPSDLGFQGGAPSHPELLDWLANELARPAEGPAWSLKRVQRLMYTSAAYRQASQVDEPARRRALAVDADNRLRWRHGRRRLEAEEFRDAALATAGALDGRLGGPGFRDFQVSSAGDNETYTVFDAVGGEFDRRSLYRTVVRSGTSPLLDALDCPDPSVAAPRRAVTSTPLQALALLNNKFMEHAAGRFADRVRREAPDDLAGQVRRAYVLAFARDPADDERAFAQAHAARHGLPELCLALLNANEFLFLD